MISLVVATDSISLPCQAEPPIVLALQMSSGKARTTIYGPIGTILQLQYVDDFSASDQWRCLTPLKLTVQPYAYTDLTSLPVGRRFYRAVEMMPPTNLVYIPPGTFTMGSPTNEFQSSEDERPQTVVTLSRGFFMGKYEVTQEEYLSIAVTNPSRFTGEPNLPVEQVSWFDATNYCTRLTERERQAGRLPADMVYRLPTEAEWEYACRASTATRFSHGDDSDYTNLQYYCWFSANGLNRTHPVGQKLSNSWGLYDMHGNVWEWCLDWSGPYTGGSTTDPRGPDAGSVRVERGGAYYIAPGSCRSANRGEVSPSQARDTLGFRVVLAVNQP